MDGPSIFEGPSMDGPSIFLVHDSPSNLAESRYPPPQSPEDGHIYCILLIRIHPKTLFEIPMALSTNSDPFPSNSHVSATFSFSINSEKF